MVITAAYQKNAIATMMEIGQGNTKLAEWSTMGTGSISMQETVSVTQNKTYTMVIKYSINGVTKPSVSFNRDYG